MIEIHFWEQLAAIAKYKTLSAASEQLHLTQPALSRSMKKLEELLGVSLFERGKNKIALNDTGIMAAEQAIRLLEFESDLTEKIRAYDRSHHTIKIGSCAPVPLREIVPHFMERYPHLTISSEIKDEDSLIRQLQQGDFQVIILSHPLEDSTLHCQEYLTEHMYFCVTKLNPLASHKEITLKDIDGQTILLYSEIGFWFELCKSKLTHSKLLLQNEFDVFKELANASEFPFFISNWHLAHASAPSHRICLPITDPETIVTYYCICKKADLRYLK